MATSCAGASPLTPSTSRSAPEDFGYQVPDVLRYQERWLSTDALDLDSADGTFIRAFLEATELTFYVGSRAASYPGYDAAISPAIAGGSAPDVDPFIDRRTAYGTKHTRITNFQETPEGTVRVTGCIADLGLPPSPDMTSEDWHLRAFVLVYERGGSATPPAKQHGQRRVPTGSVFGSWLVLAYDPLAVRTTPQSIEPCARGELDPADTVALGWPNTGV